MSLVSMIGPRPNLLGRQAGVHKRLEVAQPVLSNAELEKIRSIAELLDGAFRTATIDTTWAHRGAAGSRRRSGASAKSRPTRCSPTSTFSCCRTRAVSADRIPIPALLATAAVHHHLIRRGLRTQTGLVVETGEAREVHHFCCLAGYGAEAINPISRSRRSSRSGCRTARPEAYEVRRTTSRRSAGPAQGHVQDGHLDLPVLLRRADF